MYIYVSLREETKYLLLPISLDSSLAIALGELAIYGLRKGGRIEVEK